MKKALCAAVGLTGLLAIGSAHASLLAGDALFSSYVTNSLDANSVALHTPSNGPPAQGGSPAAQEFTVASPTMLGSLTVRLSDATPGDGGSLLVYLVANNATPALNIPSSTGLALTNATQLGTILDSSLATSAGDITIPISANLTSGTYWLALVSSSDPNNGNGNPSTSNALWYRTGDLIGLDVGNNINNTDAGLYNAHVSPSATVLTSVTGNSFEMQIDTPEPASLLLLSTGMIGIGIIRRRQSTCRAE